MKSIYQPLVVKVCFVQLHANKVLATISLLRSSAWCLSHDVLCKRKLWTTPDATGSCSWIRSFLVKMTVVHNWTDTCDLFKDKITQCRWFKAAHLFFSWHFIFMKSKSLERFPVSIYIHFCRLKSSETCNCVFQTAQWLHQSKQIDTFSTKINIQPIILSHMPVVNPIWLLRVYARWVIFSASPTTFSTVSEHFDPVNVPDMF